MPNSRPAWSLLSAEAGFLVEKKVRDALDELPEDEAELAQAESLLRALGARDDADISLLVSKFFSDGPADTEGEGDAAARALATRIKPEDVVGAAQSFVEERRRNAALKPPAADTVIGAEPVGLAAEREKERHAKQREYWTKMANVVSDDTFEVWQELEKQLEKYNTVLKQRSQEIARVTSLQEQNAQLKALINQYLNAKVNDELIVPPAATIAMNQQAAQTSAEASRRWRFWGDAGQSSGMRGPQPGAFGCHAGACASGSRRRVPPSATASAPARAAARPRRAASAARPRPAWRAAAGSRRKQSWPR